MDIQLKETDSTTPPPAYSGPAHQPPQIQYGHPQYGPAFPGQLFGQGNAPPPVIWMPAPPAIPKCPRGLEYFGQLEQITVEQQIELLEMVSGYETCNRYEVKNALGQWIYYAVEENDDFALNVHQSLRGFTIKLFDSTNQPVMQLSRGFRCDICCCPCICCLQELEIQAPPGNIIGYVKQKWHPCLPKFIIQNEAREHVLNLTAPCTACRCRDFAFQLKPLDGKSTIGSILRPWMGIARENVTDASVFRVQFPMDLDIKMKAIVTGACFLLDFMFFERTGNRNRRNQAGVRHTRR